MTNAHLRVRVQPRASANEVTGVRDGVVHVRVTAPPAEGRANDAVRKLVAKRLGIGVSRVKVVRGARGRDKTLAVEGVPEDRLAAAFRL